LCVSNHWDYYKRDLDCKGAEADSFSSRCDLWTQKDTKMKIGDRSPRSPTQNRRARTDVAGKRSSRRIKPYSHNRANEDVCRNCRRPGHFVRDCPKPRVCHNCGKEGHDAASCSSEKLCRKCRRPGHVS
ncbi:hypothetical protein KI387_013831, partial [Taxus chinensis]